MRHTRTYNHTNAHARTQSIFGLEHSGALNLHDKPSEDGPHTIVWSKKTFFPVLLKQSLQNYLNKLDEMLSRY